MKLRFDFSKFPLSLGKGTVSVMVSPDRIPVLDGQGLSGFTRQTSISSMLDALSPNRNSV